MKLIIKTDHHFNTSVQRSSFSPHVENSKNHKRWYYIATRCRNVKTSKVGHVT